MFAAVAGKIMMVPKIEKNGNGGRKK